jgi:hypothetical protein
MSFSHRQTTSTLRGCPCLGVGQVGKSFGNSPISRAEAAWPFPAFLLPCPPARQAEMDHLKQSVHEGFGRFQRLLFAMHAGDAVRPSDASYLSGLSEDVCRSVLEGLVRVGLMTHERGDQFVRKPLEPPAALPIESSPSSESDKSGS